MSVKSAFQSIDKQFHVVPATLSDPTVQSFWQFGHFFGKAAFLRYSWRLKLQILVNCGEKASTFCGSNIGYLEVEI